MKHNHRMKESKNPAGTCWEGGERESGRQEVPTEIANTTTRLFCFFGQHGESKGDKHLTWLARQDVPASDTALSLLSHWHLCTSQGSSFCCASCLQPLSFSEDWVSAGLKHISGNSCSLAKSRLAGWAARYQTSGQPISHFSLQHNTRIFVRRYLWTSGSLVICSIFRTTALFTTQCHGKTNV